MAATDDDLKACYDTTWMMNPYHYRHPDKQTKLKPYLNRREVDDTLALKAFKQALNQSLHPWEEETRADKDEVTEPTHHYSK